MVKQNLCREREIQPHIFLGKAVYVAGFVKNKTKQNLKQQEQRQTTLYSNSSFSGS